LKVTAVAPVRALPLIVTAVRTGPFVGVKLLIVGMTRNLVALVEDPPAVVTVIGPLVAPEGTTAAISVEEATVNCALVPANDTVVVPEKPLPEITTEVPTTPAVGELELMVGDGTELLAERCRSPPHQSR
jgi:hypothetical protein